MTSFEFGDVVLVPCPPGVMKPVLTAIEKGLVIRKLGRLVPADREKLRQMLEVILGR